MSRGFLLPAGPGPSHHIYSQTIRVKCILHCAHIFADSLVYWKVIHSRQNNVLRMTDMGKDLAHGRFGHVPLSV